MTTTNKTSTDQNTPFVSEIKINKMKLSLKTIVLTFVLFIINLLGLSIWKFSSNPSHNGLVQATKSRLAIVSSCIISTFVLYCLITVLSVQVPSMTGLSVSEIGTLFEFFSRTVGYISVPAVLLPVWWYYRSWKTFHEKVSYARQVIKDHISTDMATDYLVLKITQALFPVLLLYLIFLTVFIYIARRLLETVGPLGVPWEILYATIISKIYVCACVMHLIILLKFVSSFMINIGKVLSEM